MTLMGLFVMYSQRIKEGFETSFNMKTDDKEPLHFCCGFFIS